MLKYDEQLFADEVTPVAPSVEAQPAVQAEPAPIEQPKSINELSRKEQIAVFERFNAPKEQPAAPIKEQPVEVAPATEKVDTPVIDVPAVETEPPVQTYTPEEIAETGLDKLDPKRLPEAMQPYYKSMLADYTRKTQAIAEQRKQAEQVRTPQQPEQPRTKVIDRLFQERAQDMQQVEKILNEGNTGDKIEFNEWDPNHSYLMKRVSDYRVYNEQQQNSLISKSQSLIKTEQADPEFPVIMKEAEKEIVRLAGSSTDGFNMANQIVQANNRLGTPYATQEDIELIKEFWNNTKTKFKTNKEKPVTKVAPVKPPVAIEQTGPSAPTDAKPKRFNPKSAAKMSKDQLKDLFGAFAEKGK